ncbi:hypothetical protein Tco_0797683 [Tanacetum coccineum]
MIKSTVTDFHENMLFLSNESSQPQSTYEAAASLTEFELKKILINKIDKSQSYLTATEHRECYDGLIKSYDLDKSRKTKESKSGSSKGTKSPSKSSRKSIHVEEPEFKVADSDIPQDQEENLGNDDEEPIRKVSSKRDWFAKPKQPQEPTDPDWNVGKTSQQGPTQSWLITLTSSADKPSKTFDELMSTPIYFSAEQRKTFYAYARGLESSHDVYLTKHIIAVTRVEVMQKHGYGYLREIEVRRSDNKLYTFKEGDFPRLRINDIKDMMILIVQNRLTNLSGNDVFRLCYNTANVHQKHSYSKRVEDLH